MPKKWYTVCKGNAKRRGGAKGGAATESKEELLMLGKGKDKKIIDAITYLRETENAGGNPDLVSIHSRLLKGRTAFEGILTNTMTSAMNISNLDLQVSDRVEIILHPERFPERDPQRAALRAVEDTTEQNDNHFDGINPEEIVIPKKDRHSFDFSL